jgi:hypothetical protein
MRKVGAYTNVYVRHVVLWQPAVHPGVKGEPDPKVLLHAISEELKLVHSCLQSDAGTVQFGAGSE